MTDKHNASAKYHVCNSNSGCNAIVLPRFCGLSRINSCQKLQQLYCGSHHKTWTTFLDYWHTDTLKTKQQSFAVAARNQN